jgi:hypothetical protein
VLADLQLNNFKSLLDDGSSHSFSMQIMYSFVNRFLFASLLPNDSAAHFILHKKNALSAPFSASQRKVKSII